MGETVVLDFEVHSPVERVWHALTQADMLSRWMLFDATDFRPVVGHKFQLRGKPTTGWTGVVACEVLEVDEPHRLSYTWGVEANEHHTTVTWTLTGADGGVTRLHLEQSGFASHATQEIGGAKYGWMAMVDQLQQMLAAA